jgi:hypothetical protein
LSILVLLSLYFPFLPNTSSLWRWSFRMNELNKTVTTAIPFFPSQLSTTHTANTAVQGSAAVYNMSRSSIQPQDTHIKKTS